MKYSRSQIIATIGPASGDKSILREMIKCQVDAVRLNFAWGNFEEHLGYIKNTREVAEELDREVVIIADLPGPRIQDEGGHRFDNSVREIITDKDLEILKFALAEDVDYITLSYTGGAEDIAKLKEKIKELGGGAKIIAKIERKIAVENIDEIIKEADAIMIGRGDLGKAIPIEEIPFVQDDIIKKTKQAGKPVIVATQMLLSMVQSPEPTRAEVSDVSQAITEGADAVMLSEETAIGKYPVKVVEMMERIVLEAEEHNKDLQINSL